MENVYNNYLVQTMGISIGSNNSRHVDCTKVIFETSDITQSSQKMCTTLQHIEGEPRKLYSQELIT